MGILGKDYLDNPAVVGDRGMIGSLKIRRREHPKSDFATRFNLAYENCLGHMRRDTVDTLSKKFVSTLLLDAAAFTHQDRKVVLATAHSNLINPKDIAQSMGSISAQGNPIGRVKNAQYYMDDDEDAMGDRDSGSGIQMTYANFPKKKKTFGRKYPEGGNAPNARNPVEFRRIGGLVNVRDALNATRPTIYSASIARSKCMQGGVEP